MIQPEKTSHIWLCDLVFMVFSALYALLALEGVIAISGLASGYMDSDLATYAQAMTHALHRIFFFASTPFSATNSPAVDISNLERLVATLPCRATMSRCAFPGRRWPLAVSSFLLRLWYILGRWLFKSPALSALLSVLCRDHNLDRIRHILGHKIIPIHPAGLFRGHFPAAPAICLAAIKHHKIQARDHVPDWSFHLGSWGERPELRRHVLTMWPFALSKPGEQARVRYGWPCALPFPFPACSLLSLAIPSCRPEISARRNWRFSTIFSICAGQRTTAIPGSQAPAFC